jgi:hypothetical protein
MYTTIKANTTIYAHWSENTPTPTPTPTPVKFTISYNGNGATGGSVSSHTCETNGSCSIKANAFTRSGYTFKGWTTKSNGSDDGYNWTGWSGTWKYTNGQYGISNNSLVLYARWEKNATSSYIITEDSKYSGYSNIASCNSNTLKYRIISYQNQDIILIWASDPINQFQTAVAKSGAQGTLSAENILSNEISNYGYASKCMVATNASFFTGGSPNGGVVLSHGNIVKNNGASANIIGINSSGTLTMYQSKSANELKSVGVKNTAVISSPAWIDNTTAHANRTQICQVDKNNFVMLSGSGTVMGPAGQIEALTGCHNTFNLDGGGSRKLYYKTQSSSKMTKRFGGDRSLPDMVYFVEK